MVQRMVADIGHLALSLSRPRQCDSATVRQNAANATLRQNARQCDKTLYSATVRHVLEF